MKLEVTDTLTGKVVDAQDVYMIMDRAELLTPLASESGYPGWHPEVARNGNLTLMIKTLLTCDNGYREILTFVPSRFVPRIIPDEVATA